MRCTGNRKHAYRVPAGLVLVLVLVPPVHGGEAHRWIDADGAVHYGDAPPPESVRATGTDAEAADADNAEEAAAPDAPRDAKRARHDRMLLHSYSTVEDLERTRDRRLDGVDARIGLATNKVRRTRRRAEDIAQALQELPDEHDERAELEQALATAHERLERARAALAELEETRAQMAESFAADIARFRELTAERE